MTKSAIVWKARQIEGMVDTGSLTFNNIIQRGFVWDRKRCTLLVDSILRRYPVPPIFTIQTDKKITTPKGQVSVFDVIDGKQRCLTVSKFRKNEFALEQMDPVTLEDGTEIDVTGMTYEQLPDELKKSFDDFSFNVYFFIDTTMDEIVEMMSRLNNGKPMSSIELLRIKAKDLEGIQKLAYHSFLKENLSATAINGYQNEDIIIKMAMLLESEDGNIGLEAKDTKPIYENIDFSKDKKELSKRIEAVLDTIQGVHDIMTNESKKNAKKLTNKTHMTSCAKFIDTILCDDECDWSDEEIAKFLLTFFDGNPSMNDEYNEATKNGTNHAANVATRIKAINDEYLWFTGQSEPTETIDMSGDDNA